MRLDQRGRINGVAHGSSSSGATIFVEPMQTIEANNELQSLREAEQREIAEILFDLSEELRRQLPAIQLASEAVTELDFINAKAVFGENFNCVIPEIGTEPLAVVSGIAAYDSSIPSTLALVLLDEVGTGTDPEEGSALGVAVVDHFKHRGAHVLATTHYSGLKMYAANEPSVLNASVEFDEETLRPTYRLLLGLAGSSSGLDIARRFGIPSAVISQANEKLQQSSRDGIEYLRRIRREAQVAEDLRRALEEERGAVAEKFAALDRQFENRERERQSEFEKQMTRAIADFDNQSRELVAKIQDRADRVKVEREAQKRAAELKRAAQGAANQRRREPSDETISAALRGVRVVRDGKVVGDGRKYGAAAESVRELAEGGPEIHAPSDKRREIRIGDRVRLPSLGSIGIVDQIKDNQAEVRVGSLHLREKLENLELISGTGVPPGSYAADARAIIKRGSSPTVREGSLEQMRREAPSTELHLHSKDSDSKFKTNSELNLIGKTTDEAVELVDKFLDDAFLNGHTEVRIIHGHGTGALRRAITEFLADHPHVARFGAAPQDQGGSGATIVELRF